MVGGSDHAYERLGPIVESIAAQVDGTPCATHVGPDGAGHFVKMVHNGIEYADMQLIAEAFDLLRNVAGLEPAEIAKVFRTWNEGDLESFLIEMTADVLEHTDAETGRPFVDVVADAAEQKGTGRWTVQSALDLGVPITGIAEATFARSLSGHVEQRAAARERLRNDPPDRPRWPLDVRPARGRRPRPLRRRRPRRALRLQGRRLRPGLRPDRGRLRARTAGTSTSAPSPPSGAAAASSGPASSDRISEAYEHEPDLTTLLTADYFADAVRTGADAWRRVVVAAAEAGVPTPAFSSSLAYFDGLRRERLPAALIQALRDNFGAHTYRRVDKEGTFHTDWAGTGLESASA